MTRCDGLLWVALLAYGMTLGCDLERGYRATRHREVIVTEREDPWTDDGWIVETWCACRNWHKDVGRVYAEYER